MNLEPKWRTFLCWGVVLTYLTAPLVFFLVHLNASPELDYRLTHGTGFLRDFYVSVTGILISLAGLNTYQVVTLKRNNGGSAERKKHEQSPELTREL